MNSFGRERFFRFIKENLENFNENVEDPENFHDLRVAAVLMPIFFVENEPHLIFTQRSENLRSHAGQVSFPGGKVEKEDCSTLETALRESSEEIGLRRRDVRVVGRLAPVVARNGLIVFPFVGLLREGFLLEHLQRDAAEVARIFSAPVAHFTRRENYGTWIHKESGKAFPNFDVALRGDDADVSLRVWGLTAMLVVRFVQCALSPSHTLPVALEGRFKDDYEKYFTIAAKIIDERLRENEIDALKKANGRSSIKSQL